MEKNRNEMPSFGLIENKSLREHVVDILHAAIVNGDLKPGQTLIEGELAAQLGVSRAPLREAINILSTEGLVEIVPYHGTTVKKRSAKDIEELYSIRNLMEGFAIHRVIASKGSPELVVKLREICNDMLAAAEIGDLRQFNQIDLQFHDALVASSNNDLLIMLWNTVSLHIHQVMSLRNYGKNRLHEIAGNHKVIVDCIEREDIEGTIRLIDQHIGNPGDQITERLEADTSKEQG